MPRCYICDYSDDVKSSGYPRNFYYDKRKAAHVCSVCQPPTDETLNEDEDIHVYLPETIEEGLLDVGVQPPVVGQRGLEEDQE